MTEPDMAQVVKEISGARVSPKQSLFIVAVIRLYLYTKLKKVIDNCLSNVLGSNFVFSNILLLTTDAQTGYIKIILKQNTNVV